MLHFRPSTDQVRHIIAIGAHPDDIEIGCGATLLSMAATCPGLTADFIVLTGSDARQDEARRASELFLPGVNVRVHALGLPDGRLPGHWDAVKETLETIARSCTTPDVLLTPGRDDAHQDHRTVSRIVPTVWRDHAIFEYELPKWDGDLAQPSVYVPLAPDLMQEKVLRLNKAFPSQASRDWWDDEVFFGLARIRGMECRARYAEAFTSRKTVLQWG